MKNDGINILHSIFRVDCCSFIVNVLLIIECLSFPFLSTLFLQLHAVPPLSGPWRFGVVASDFILFLFLSGPSPPTTLPPATNQREQRGPQPHILSYCVWRSGGALQRSALQWWRWQLRASLQPGLHVPRYQQQWSHSSTDSPEGRTGGSPGCHLGTPGAQAAQHTTGQEETMGVSKACVLRSK